MLSISKISLQRFAGFASEVGGMNTTIGPMLGVSIGGGEILLILMSLIFWVAIVGGIIVVIIMLVNRGNRNLLPPARAAVKSADQPPTAPELKQLRPNARNAERRSRPARLPDFVPPACSKQGAAADTVTGGRSRHLNPRPLPNSPVCFRNWKFLNSLAKVAWARSIRRGKKTSTALSR